MATKVQITRCTIAGVHKTGYLTGEKHTNENGTRHEVITYHSIRDEVVNLWLHESQFSEEG